MGRKFYFNLQYNIGLLVFILAIEGRIDYLSAILQIKPSVLAIRKFQEFRYTYKPILKKPFLRVFPRLLKHYINL